MQGGLSRAASFKLTASSSVLALWIIIVGAKFAASQSQSRAEWRLAAGGWRLAAVTVTKQSKCLRLCSLACPPCVTGGEGGGVGGRRVTVYSARYSPPSFPMTDGRRPGLTRLP